MTTDRNHLDHHRQDRANLEAELRLAGCTDPTRKDCRCPFHDDRSASGSIFQGDDGAWKFHCHTPSCAASGDAFDLQARRQGRPVADVLRDTRQGATLPAKPSPTPTAPSAKTDKPKRTWGTVEEMAKDLTRHGYTLAQTYTYGPDRAAPVACVFRFEAQAAGEGKPAKTFRQGHRREDGRWVATGLPAPRPMFRLPGVLADKSTGEPIVITEGEKAALAVCAAGGSGTTNMGGAGAAHLTDWAPLAGASVILWRDNDDDGVKHAKAVLVQLAALNPRPIVRIVEVSDLPPKADAADLPKTEIVARIGAALESEPYAWPEGVKEPEEVKPEGTREANIVRMSDVEPEQIDWLWWGRIARSKLHLIAGDPGLGKSTVALDIAAKITTGDPWPFDSAPRRKPAGVVILMAEDGLADTIRPRLDAAGANPCHVFAVQSVKQWGKDGKAKESALTLRDLDAIEKAVKQAREEAGECSLVVIDPITAYLGDADSFKDSEVRGLFAPLGLLADRLGVAVLMVAHLNKNAGGKAAYRVGGSIAFTAAVRVALAVAKDKDDKALRLMAPIKANICPDKDGLGYRLVPSSNPDHPKVAWEPAPEGIDGDSILGEGDEAAPGGDLDAHLKHELQTAGSDGMPFAQLQALGKDLAGYGEHAVRSSLKRLGASSRPKGYKGAHHWHLPAGKPPTLP